VHKISTLTSFPVVDRCVASERSFDFSSFQNLQEVYLGFAVNCTGGGLLWIPLALSTLRRATSPRLSSLRLDCIGSPVNQSVETLIEDMRNGLRRVADEFTRINREFEGAVNLTVVRDPGFEVVLDALNVSARFRPLRDLIDPSSFDYLLVLPTDPSAARAPFQVEKLKPETLEVTGESGAARTSWEAPHSGRSCRRS